MWYSSATCRFTSKPINPALRWRHNERDCVSNHQSHDCFLNCLFRRRSKKTSKLRVTGLCAGNSSGTGEFPAQMASNAENVSIWWRHHGFTPYLENVYQWIHISILILALSQNSTARLTSLTLLSIVAPNCIKLVTIFFCLWKGFIRKRILVTPSLNSTK